MARTKMQPGDHGKITRVKVAPGKWYAHCDYVPADGVAGEKKNLKRTSPVGERDSNGKAVKDPHGKRAEDRLRKDLPKYLAGQGRSRPDEDATLAVLLRAEMAKVLKKPEEFSRRTMDSYSRVERVLLSEHPVCVREGHNHFGDVAGRPARSVTAADLKTIVSDIEAGHDRVTAAQARTLLRMVGEFLVDSKVWSVNLASAVTFKKRKRGGAGKSAPKSAARALGRADAFALMDALRSSGAELPPSKSGTRATGRTVSEFAQSVDLVDPIMMALWLGLRRSELLAITWDDIDFDERVVSIRHHLIRAYRRDGVGEGPATELIHELDTKTEESEREIALPDEVVEMLRRRRREFMAGERVAPRKGLPPVVFPTTVGGLRDPDTFASQWTRVRGALGVPWLSLHGFRKSTARILHDAGFTTREIADVLGHVQISMTEDTYIGRESGPLRAVAAGMSAALGGSGA